MTQRTEGIWSYRFDGLDKALILDGNGDYLIKLIAIKSNVTGLTAFIDNVKHMTAAVNLCQTVSSQDTASEQDIGSYVQYLKDRVRKLEERNQQLSQMLESLGE